MPDVAIYLLGAPRIVLDGRPVTIERRKTLALLAYLAVAGRVHRREELITLLWPDLDSARGRAQLRNILFDLQRVIGKGWLDTEGDQVILRAGPGLFVDIGRFHELLAQVVAHSHPSHRVCDACLVALTEAASLYTADFLAGFTLEDAAEFDAWQSFQTESLRLELAGVLEKLATGLAGRQEYDAAISHARRWSALDPLHDPAQRLLMQLHAGAGDRAAAIRQYQECVRVLQAELGIEPEPETTALFEAIRGGAAGLPSAPMFPGSPAPVHNLPPDPTPFIGREPELAQMAERLADPACRLLTILGPGGMGKTRLAIQAARSEADRFAHGACFVDLAPVASAEQLAEAILRALQVPSQGATAPDQHILNHLADKQMLLVLDNYEHLLRSQESGDGDQGTADGTGLLTAILQGAPRVKLLVTSRIRLNVRREWLAPLEGLEVPGDLEHEGAKEPHCGAGEEREARSGAHESSRSSRFVSFEDLRDFAIQPAALERYSATALFLACVRRVQPDFRPAAGDARRIAHICRLLEGTPLAIELAAAWIRALPLAQIERELKQGLDLLATTMRDVVPRHRSMTAAFDHSWRLLSPSERSILRQLSVFRGGCTREAAHEVTGATAADLVGLADASWLRLGAHGRYQMHELTRQYCAEKLVTEQREGSDEHPNAVRRRHAAYYSSQFHALDQAILQQLDATKAITADLSNAQAAWQWAIAAGEVELVRRTGQALQNAEALGWLPDALPDLDTAIAQLKTDVDLERRPDLVALLAYILALKGERLIRQGLYQDAHLHLTDGLERLGGVDMGEKIVEEAWFWIRYRLAELLRYQGQFIESTRLLEAQLAYLEDHRVVGHGSQLDDAEVQFRQSQHYHFLIMNAWCMGHYNEAQTYAEQNPAMAGKAGEYPRAHALRWLAVTLHALGAYARAQRVLRQALSTLRAFGDSGSIALTLHTLGLIEVAAGRHLQARALFRRSLTTAEELGSAKLRVQALNGLAATALALGQIAEAQRLYEQSVAMFERPGSGPGLHLASAIAGLGQVALAEHETNRAMSYFRQALNTAGRAAWETAHALVGMAHAVQQEGNVTYAAELLACAESWPAAWYETRQQAAHALNEIAAQLPPDAFAAAVTRGRARQMDEVVAELVAG